MIVALILGREGSIGFPGKNIYPVLGRPLMVYPLLAAKAAVNVDEVYVSTDSDKIKQVSLEQGAKIIDRPSELATKEALGEDAYAHGFRHICDTLGKSVELIVLLFATLQPFWEKLSMLAYRLCGMILRWILPLPCLRIICGALYEPEN